uniref:Uncharacterized protein n=1 Tax=Chenopodium quinoa TaxID=63459 RepID=A0A803KPN1_CHEQI
MSFFVPEALFVFQMECLITHSDYVLDENLTPDLLTELPDDYTFETTLADLIDDSLQAVWSNGEGERKLIRNGEATIKAFVSVSLSLGDQPLAAQFQEIPAELRMSEAERRLLALIEMDQSKPDLKWINAIPINKNTSSLALVVAFKILETRGLGFKDWWKNSYRGKILDECKFCGREGTITMIPKSGRYLTGDDCEAGKHFAVELVKHFVEELSDSHSYGKVEDYQHIED